LDIVKSDIVLCKFYFSDSKQSKLRPVIVYKDNLPFHDFIGIPISSQIENLKEDEFIITGNDFSSGNIPKSSKVMVRKPFAISKSMIVKKYGALNTQTFSKVQNMFCKYFGCP